MKFASQKNRSKDSALLKITSLHLKTWKKIWKRTARNFKSQEVVRTRSCKLHREKWRIIISIDWRMKEKLWTWRKSERCKIERRVSVGINLKALDQK